MAVNPSGSDLQVMGTNDDAQISKLSCVNLGYFKDDFLSYFIRKPQRRSPLINRGYFSRFAIIRKIITDFLALTKNSQQQIISLGAGFDTCWFQLQKENMSPSKFIEIDFDNVFKRKAQIILSNRELKETVFKCGEVNEAKILQSGSIITEQYCLLPVDLRDIGKVGEELNKVGVRFEDATLILSECCLVYMDPQDSSQIVSFFGSNFKQSIMVIYEQIQPDDAFGRQMVTNLEQRGCPLRGLKATPTIQAHIQRLTDNNWRNAFCKDMDSIYREIIERVEREKIEKLEIFDEFEEWHMIQQHYCIAIGVNDNARQLEGSNILKQFK